MGGFVLNEKKPRLSLTVAIVILSICILFSAFTLSSAIRDLKETNDGTLNMNYRDLMIILKI